MGRAETRTVRLLIRKTLLGSDEIQTLVGGRVFGSRLEDAKAIEQLGEGPILVFEFLSGNARSGGYVAGQTFELYGYSKRSLDQAAEIYDTAFEVLHESRLAVAGGAMCGVSREIQRPVEGHVDNLDAWFMRGRWIATTATGT